MRSLKVEYEKLNEKKKQDQNGSKRHGKEEINEE